MPKLNATTKWTILYANSKIKSPQHDHINSTTKWIVQKLEKDNAYRCARLSHVDKLEKTSATSQTVSSPTGSCEQLKSERQIHCSGDMLDEFQKATPSNESSSVDTCSQDEHDNDKGDYNAKCTSEQQNNQVSSDFDMMDRHYEGNMMNNEADTSSRTNLHGFRGNCEKDEDITSKEEVPVQYWDHYIKDLSKSVTKSKTSASQTQPVVSSHWDGTRRNKSAEAVATLLKEKSSGFGERVLTWEGSCSVLDREKDLTRNKDGRKRWLEHYEEELDRGKTKKVKKKQTGDAFNGHVNMFQSYQNLKNTEKKQNVPINHRLRS